LYLLDLLGILSHLDTSIGLYDEDSDATANGRKLVIIITSERGLCGGLNSKLLRKVLSETDTDTTDYFVVGKK
jgi:F0F1-type ATP synthase gamma subunit